MIDRFGRKGLADDLAPAIHIAEQGFPVTEWVSVLWFDNADLLRKDKEAAHLYLINDQPLRVGQVFKNPDVAATLRKVGADGRDVFYKGDVAKRIVQASNEHGGVMTLEDLSTYSAEWVEPMSTTYRGWTVYELPPNGQGVAALEMLNIMENFPLQVRQASAGGQLIAGQQRLANLWAFDQALPLHIISKRKTWLMLT